MLLALLLIDLPLLCVRTKEPERGWGRHFPIACVAGVSGEGRGGEGRGKTERGKGRGKTERGGSEGPPSSPQLPSFFFSSPFSLPSPFYACQAG